MSKLHVVAGAMFGSEGKGHITAQLIEHPDYRKLSDRVLNIRVAGPNAGHTVVDGKGVAFPLRTIPVGAAVDHEAVLLIAPGSEIELEVLESEVKLLREHGHPVKHLFVSGEATLLEQKHKDTETSLDLHAKLGSTGKGIGAARADRIMRSAQRIIDSEDALNRLMDIGADVIDANQYVDWMADWLEKDDAQIVIEGTQGYGLGLHAGHYPTCTSSDARGIDFMAMAGIMPWSPGVVDVTIWLVARVFPIRVAGQSGPLKGETSWDDLGLPEERTTVTHKVRRVGEWDADLMRQAVVANGGATFGVRHEFLMKGFSVVVALTMVDQKIPGLFNKTEWRSLSEADNDELSVLIRSVENDAGTTVGMVSTGPKAVLPIW
jgi:adenylosuccinate synthase